MSRKRVYVVQGDPRDHHGEVLLVTADSDEALKLCAKLIKDWNKPQDETDKVETRIQADYKTMPQDKFLDIYLGSAWITSPQIVTKYVDL